MPSSFKGTVRFLSERGLQQLPDPVIWISQQGQILQVNAAACQLYGYTTKQFSTLTVFDLNPQFQPDQWELHWRKDRLDPKRIQTTHRKADGKTVSVEVLNCWEEVDGHTYSCSIIRDMSQEQQKAANLKRLWEQTRQQDKIALLSQFSVDRSSDGIVWLAADGQIKYVNEAMCQRLHYSKEELLAMTIFDVNRNFDPQRLQGLWKRLRQEDTVLLESGHYTKEGQFIPVEINTNFIIHEGEEFACSIVRDITERKAQEAALKQALVEIRQLKEKVEAENEYLQEEISNQQAHNDIITQSENMKVVLHQVDQVAPTDSTVLILGESGTGKELIANAIHRFSRRSGQSFVKLNCAALPEQLIESELFGHEKGAFTGAFQRKIGKFELADDGTLFLDEIGELPLPLQAKLLRALQEGEIERLGSETTMHVNVRIIAATNRDLQEMVRAGTFRNDLYFRLFVFPLSIPPLRERPQDIPVLVEHFCQKHQKRMGKKIETIPNHVMKRLQTYHFPGNIRELENIIERAIIMSTQGTLALPGIELQTTNSAHQAEIDAQIDTFETMQRKHIIAALIQTNWRVSGKGGAAEMLDLPSTTLRSKMQKLGIKRSVAAL